MSTIEWIIAGIVGLEVEERFELRIRSHVACRIERRESEFGA